MLSLRETQQRFLRGVLAGDAEAITPWINSAGLPAAERIGIYRNNCREGFAAALTLGYPVLQRLTGEAYFRQLARDYQRRHPSQSGNLLHVGTQLPAFLEQRFAGTQYDYFSHVARLEWACQEVLVAADHAAFGLARLAAVPSADYPRLRFDLHPAARLVSAPYPVFRIWETHQDAADPGPIDLGSGGEQALVRRSGDGVVICRLAPGEYECLATLGSARPLGRALEAALTANSTFDLRQALQRWAQIGLIVNFSVLGESADT